MNNEKKGHEERLNSEVALKIRLHPFVQQTNKQSSKATVKFLKNILKMASDFFTKRNAFAGGINTFLNIINRKGFGTDF